MIRSTLAAALTLALVAQAVGADDWPGFRGNGAATTPSLPEKVPDKPLWSAPVAGPCAAGIAVAEGAVIVADHEPGKRDVYRRFDPAGGKEVWAREFPNDRSLDYGGGPRATPLIRQGRVFVLSAFGEFRCLDLKTGKTLWEKDYRKDYGVEKVPTWGFCTSPVVARGKVVIHPGGKGGLVALDPETGKQAWATPDTDPNYSTFVVETLGGVEQLVGSDAASLGGWDAATGKRLWKVPVKSKGYVVPSPLKVGDRLFVTDDGNGPRLFAFKAGGLIDPKPAAEAEKPAPESYTPVASGGVVLGVAKGLTALDAKTLEVLYSDDDRAFDDECPVIVAGDRGLALTPSGRAVCFKFDRKGVEVTGATKVCGPTRAHPAVADGVLYVRDAKTIRAYRLTPPK